MCRAIFLSTAFITTLGVGDVAKKRIVQYCGGIGQIVDRYGGRDGVDIYLCDNTVDDISVLDDKIQLSVARLGLDKIILFDENQYGRINKGCGLIAQWRKALPVIAKEHKYVIHFEPRQRIIDYKFIDSCLEAGENMFREDLVFVRKYKIFKREYSHFQTGLFGLDINDLMDFTFSVKDMRMVKRSISIERMLYVYCKKIGLNYQGVSELGLMWDSQGRDIAI